MKLVKVLYYINLKTQINFPCVQGSPLSVACHCGYECIVDVLINCGGATVPPPMWDAGPDAGQGGVATHCPFYQAIFNGWTTILQMLIEARPGRIWKCRNL